MDTMKAKICARRDTTANWAEQTSLVPLLGEIIVYVDHGTITDEMGNTVNVPGFKVGDGVNVVGNLPFVSQDDIDDLREQIAGCISATDPVFEGSISMGRKEDTDVGEESVALGYEVEASGDYSQAEGTATSATGDNAHAEGFNTTASGSWSHAEGSGSEATSTGAHAEGTNTSVTGDSAHAEGLGTIAAGSYSHASGMFNVADSYADWPEWQPGHQYAVGDKVKRTISGDQGDTVYGYVCLTANSDQLFNVLKWTPQDGKMNYAEVVGNGTSDQDRANARTLDWEGNERLAGDLYVNCTDANPNGQKVGTQAAIDLKADKADTVLDTTLSRGRKEYTTVGSASFAFGYNVTASGNQSHAEGSGGTASGTNSHVEGATSTATGDNSHAEGEETSAGGRASHAEGYKAKTTAQYAHAEGSGTTASGEFSHAEGGGTTASGVGAHAEGAGTTASYPQAHAEGGGTTASAYFAHAEGNETNATATASHAEGSYATASGIYSHAEGYNTLASGYEAHAEGYGGTYTLNGTNYTSEAVGTADHTEGYLCLTASNQPGNHAEGYMTQATGGAAHAEGSTTVASAQQSHAEGLLTTASAQAAHAEGKATIASGAYSHSEGLQNTGVTTTSYNGTTYTYGASGEGSHSEGLNTVAYGAYSHAEGNVTFSIGAHSHAEGYATGATGDQSHAEGGGTKATAAQAHAEGGGTTASASNAHSEGSGTIASGVSSHAEGSGTTAFGNNSHAEGSSSRASGANSHVEGNGTTASGALAHAEGGGTTASGIGAHAEGSSSTASGDYSHTEGTVCIASGVNAHAEGLQTIAAGSNSHVSGTYNVADSYDNWPEWTANTSYAVGDKVKRTTTSNNVTSVAGYICKTANSDSSFNSSKWTAQNGLMNYAEIVGNGGSSARSNARALDWEGNEYLAGSVYVGCGTDSTGGTKLATETFVTGKMGTANGIAELDENGKVPSSQLPSYVDDVEEYEDAEHFPATGESGKIYIALDTNVTYRWGGSTYVAIGSSLALGETESTAYRGDRGAAAYAAAVTNVESSPSSGSANLITSGAVYTAVNTKYTKPSGGIPAEDLASGVIPGNMTGADGTNAGTSGLVPAPAATDNTKFLKGDGTWDDVDALPAVTSSDNGKALVVSNGEWAVDNISSGLPAVTSSDNGKVLEVSSGAWAVGTEKAPKASPVFTGSISLGRKANTTVGANSFAVGNNVTASNGYSHAEGDNTVASGGYAHAEGNYTTASGNSAHAEGEATTASGKYAHSEGNNTTAQRQSQHVAGEYNVLDATGTVSTRGTYVEIIGNGSANDQRSNARALDWNGNEYLKGDVYVGCDADSTGGSKLAKVSELPDVSALAPKASPVFTGSISLDRKTNTTVGTNSFAVGYNVTASNSNTHAEGYSTKATGSASHSEGKSTEASASYSHAEGDTTFAMGATSHTEGHMTTATHYAQHVAGEYNVLDPSSAGSTEHGNYVEIIGNGTGSSARSNARALDWSGNERLMGDIYVGCNADSTGGTKLTAPVAMTGATSSVAGTAGYAPAPAAGDDTKFLRGDGTWAAAGADLGLIAAAYDPTATYSENDYCTHEGGLYKANQDISTAEAWTAAHWTQTTVMAEIIARCSIIPAAGVSF